MLYSLFSYITVYSYDIIVRMDEILVVRYSVQKPGCQLSFSGTSEYW